MTVASTSHLHSPKAGSAFAYLRPRLGLELTGEFIVAGYSGKTGDHLTRTSLTQY